MLVIRRAGCQWAAEVSVYLWNPQMLLRALLGRVSLGPSYTCVNLEFKLSYLEEILRLPKEKIVIDSTFGFDQVKDAFERLNTGRRSI